jgi:hypothetical protein
MLAYGCGTGIGGRNGGRFAGCVFDGICGADCGGRERTVTVETRFAACGGIGVIGAGLRAGGVTVGAGSADTRPSTRFSGCLDCGFSAWGFAASTPAILRVNGSWPAAG